MARIEADLVKDRASALPVAALLATVAAGHLSLFPRVADRDGFYHLGHALAYLEGSLLDTSLPWATRSIIGETGGDLWWGFHVLLLPFGALGVEWGVRAAGVVLTLSLGLTVFWVLRRHGVQGAGWWAALFLVAVPNVFFRHLMVRPHVLSLAASVALLSVLVRGRWWQVGLLAAVISWLHLSLFWLGPAVAGAYAVARIPVRVALGSDKADPGVPIRAALPAALAGAAVGWALRPDALAAATLLNVQLVELFALKATEAPLTFSAELSPLGVAEAVRSSGLFALAWTTAMLFLMVRAVVALRKAAGPAGPGRPGPVAALGEERVTLLVTAALVSTIFLGLTLLSARRAMEQWVAFGFLCLPLLWTGLRHARGEAHARDDGRRPDWMRLARVPAAILLAVHLGWAAWRHSLNVSQVAFPADTLRQAAEFLEANSRPGDLVFHARWDNFGPLFARNRTNHYLGGMDPVFLFAHDAASYWEFFYLSADATTEWTCDAYPCAQGVATDTHQALTDHFGARWIVVEPFRNPRLSLYLVGDPRYRLAFEGPHSAVFEVVRDGVDGGGDAPMRAAAGNGSG